MLPARREDIIVIGCGCLGSALAVRLGARCNIFVHDVDADRLKQFRSGAVKGVQALKRLGDGKGRVFDAAIITTKCRDVKIAASALARHCQARRVLFLQNGDFPLAWTRKIFPKAAICRGVTTMAARTGARGAVDILFEGRTSVGAFAGELADARWFVDVLERAGLHASAVGDYRGAVWSKLIFSAVMNPLPILIDGDYGALRTDKDIYDLVIKAMDEGKQVARAMKIPLAFDPAAIVRALRNKGGRGMAHRGSMYHDLMRHVPSEAPYITGAVTARARALGIKTPVLDTIGALTGIMEQYGKFGR